MMDDFDADLRRRLGDVETPPPFRHAETWAAVRRELNRTGARAPRVLRIPRWLAAAALVLAFGLGSGITLVARPLVGDRVPPDTDVDPDGTVQRAGTEFVRAIGALGDAHDPGLVDDGRQVAISAMRGAAAELMRLSPADSVPLAPGAATNLFRF